jgi:hypothetical protein
VPGSNNDIFFVNACIHFFHWRSRHFSIEPSDQTPQEADLSSLSYCIVLYSYFIFLQPTVGLGRNSADGVGRGRRLDDGADHFFGIEAEPHQACADLDGTSDRV